jgi:hypothetical protein
MLKQRSQSLFFRHSLIRLPPSVKKKEQETSLSISLLMINEMLSCQ